MAPPLKRRSASGIEEISFDTQAREDYLTGFHKRKLQRIKHAQDEAAKKDRAERIEARKLLRERRRLDLEKHVQEVNEMLKNAHGAAAEADDFETSNVRSDDEVPYFPRIGNALDFVDNQQYIDEDQYALVTVEPMSLEGDISLAGKDEFEDKDSSQGFIRGGKHTLRPLPGGERMQSAKTPGYSKKKKKKFRYESKVERKLSKSKQHMKNGNAARARKGKS